MIWTKSAIRAARKADLAPLLIERGYRILPVQNGNFKILPDANGTHPSGLVVKESFWIWHERDLAGNTIDFFVKIEGKTFQQAMQIISASQGYDSAERKTREELGRVAETVR